MFFEYCCIGFFLYECDMRVFLRELRDDVLCVVVDCWISGMYFLYVIGYIYYYESYEWWLCDSGYVINFCGIYWYVSKYFCFFVFFEEILSVYICIYLL